MGQLEAGGMYRFAILNSEPPSLTSTPQNICCPNMHYNIRCVPLRKHACVGHETHDTTPSGGSVSSDGCVSPELLEGGARDQFSLLQTGDLHMVFVQEALQFCVAVTNAVAVELQDVASPEVNTCSTSAWVVMTLWTQGST